MDFLFSDFIEFKNVNGKMMHIDASKIVGIEQDEKMNFLCYAVMVDGKGMWIPMPAAELRRKISEIRARGQKTLRTLLK